MDLEILRAIITLAIYCNNQENYKKCDLRNYCGKRLCDF